MILIQIEMVILFLCRAENGLRKLTISKQFYVLARVSHIYKSVNLVQREGLTYI